VTLAITWVCAARSSMKEYVRRSGWSEGAPCTRPLVTGFTSRAATSACRNTSGKSWKCAVRKESRRTWCGSWTDTSRWFTQDPTALSNNEVPQIDLQRPPSARSSAPAHSPIRALTVDHRQRPVSDSGATSSHGSIHPAALTSRPSPGCLPRPPSAKDEDLQCRAGRVPSVCPFSGPQGVNSGHCRPLRGLYTDGRSAASR
jgi:hypothetical protein